MVWVLLPALEISVGDRINLHCLLQEAIEQVATCSGSAAVEAEGKFIEVIVQVLMAHSSMMGAHQPALKEGNDVMHSRQELAWRFFASLEENDLMDVAFPFPMGRSPAVRRVRMTLPRSTASSTKGIRLSAEAFAMVRIRIRPMRFPSS